MFFVKKKNGDLRLCTDYRALNKITIKDRNPLPLISDLLRSLSTGKIFSVLDLRGAYELLRIKEGHESKSAFLTKYGQFEFLIMPFGLSNAPAQFQKMMDSLFRDKQNFVVVYLDDIVIYSDNASDHKQHLREVLQILQENNLFCKQDKCHFFQSEISYLGYLVSANGIRMDPSKVASISEWPAPTSTLEIQMFLGFANFYLRFIPQFAEILTPLTSLLKKNSIFLWSSETESAFQTIKSAFLNKTILAHPQDEKPYILECDSSQFAIAGILSQYDSNSVLRPVSFYSRKMTPAELSYEIYDMELLAVHECFVHWRHFLQGSRHQISVLTDHNNLKYFRDARKLTPRQARWSLFFNEFDFLLTHRPGKRHGKPDAISRRPDYKSSVPPSPLLRMLHDRHFATITSNINLKAHINALFSSTGHVTYPVLHRRLGHIGEHMLRKTLVAVDGVSLSSPKPLILCSPCSLGKSKRQPVAKQTIYKPALLEVIQSDSQGLFPILAIDGSRSNIKFIDTYSGYLKMETLPDSTAASALSAFQRYQARLERRTGCKIKALRTDGGSEFMGSFGNNLVSNGIILQKGFPHYHTHPAKAERVHQSIMMLGRAMLIESQLPAAFYAEAQLTAAYLHNRTVHGNHTITPYEYIYKRRPNISHLRPFGCIAYAHIYLENRTKLHPSADRCRLIGYIDSDDSQEHQGYKLIREADNAILFSRDVQFDENAPITALPDTNPFDDTADGELLFGDPSYSTFHPASRTPPSAFLISKPQPNRKLHYHTQTVSPDHILPHRLRSRG